LVFGTLRFYHQLNDVVSGLLKHSLEKQDLDIHWKRLVQNTSLYQNLEGDKHQPLDLTLAPVVQL
jgi:hypothetical protein